MTQATFQLILPIKGVRIQYEGTGEATIYIDTAYPAAMQASLVPYGMEGTLILHSTEEVARNYVKNMLGVPGKLIQEFQTKS